MRTPLLFLLAMLSACSVVNRDHCGNQDGDATCVERDPSRPFCSICVADNDGCLAQAPAAECGVVSSGPASTGPAPSTTDLAPTTGPAVSTTTTGDPATTGTADGTSTTTTSTPDPTTGTTGATTDDGTTDPSGTTTPSDPVCGNNKKEGDEVCDGTDLAMKRCATLLPDKWGGGVLKCNDCSSYNDSECCIGLGQPCNPLMPEEACCDPLTCTLDMLTLAHSCQNR